MSSARSDSPRTDGDALAVALRPRGDVEAVGRGSAAVALIGRLACVEARVAANERRTVSVARVQAIQMLATFALARRGERLRADLDGLGQRIDRGEELLERAAGEAREALSAAEAGRGEVGQLDGEVRRLAERCEAREAVEAENRERMRRIEANALKIVDAQVRTDSFVDAAAVLVALWATNSSLLRGAASASYSLLTLPLRGTAATTRRARRGFVHVAHASAFVAVAVLIRRQAEALGIRSGRGNAETYSAALVAKLREAVAAARAAVAQ